MKTDNLKLKIATAFAPANISCVFTIQKGNTPETTSSTGFGFTINEGVNVTVSILDKEQILFNGEEIDFPTVKSVVSIITSEAKQSYKSYLINLKSSLPLGCGFGLSGASALATAFAINDLLGLKKTKLQLAKIAHLAEVENKTGLGDVVNQYYGGILLKTQPSYKFKVKKLPINSIPVFCKVFSKISTKSVISNPDQIEKINKAGETAINEIVSRIGRHEQKKYGVSVSQKNLFSEIITISKQFAVESGLLKDHQVIREIKEIESKGGNASMVMLGNTVFSDIPFNGSLSYITG